MNPFDLSASDLLIWGLVLHLIADWPLQNDWMANHKAMRGKVRQKFPYWWYRHPAAYVHAGIHTVLLAIIFSWVAVPLGIAHLLIDTRYPVQWWSKLVRQTQPSGRYVSLGFTQIGDKEMKVMDVVYDVGTEVRFWTDQVFHIACIAVAALLVAW